MQWDGARGEREMRRAWGTRPSMRDGMPPRHGTPGNGPDLGIVFVHEAVILYLCNDVWCPALLDPWRSIGAVWAELFLDSTLLGGDAVTQQVGLEDLRSLSIGHCPINVTAETELISA